MARYVAQSAGVWFGQLFKEIFKSFDEGQEFRVRFRTIVSQVGPFTSLGPLWTHYSQAFFCQTHQTVVQTEGHDGLRKLSNRQKQNKNKKNNVKMYNTDEANLYYNFILLNYVINKIWVNALLLYKCIIY